MARETGPRPGLPAAHPHRRAASPQCHVQDQRHLRGERSGPRATIGCGSVTGPVEKMSQFTPGASQSRTSSRMVRTVSPPAFNSPIEKQLLSEARGRGGKQIFACGQAVRSEAAVRVRANDLDRSPALRIKHADRGLRDDRAHGVENLAADRAGLCCSLEGRGLRPTEVQSGTDQNHSHKSHRCRSLPASIIGYAAGSWRHLRRFPIPTRPERALPGA